MVTAIATIPRAIPMIRMCFSIVHTKYAIAKPSNVEITRYVIDIALLSKKPKTLKIRPTKPYEITKVRIQTIIPPAVDVAGAANCKVKSQRKNSRISVKPSLKSIIKTTIEIRIPTNFFMLMRLINQSQVP